MLAHSTFQSNIDIFLAILEDQIQKIYSGVTSNYNGPFWISITEANFAIANQKALSVANQKP